MGLTASKDKLNDSGRYSMKIVRRFDRHLKMYQCQKNTSIFVYTGIILCHNFLGSWLINKNKVYVSISNLIRCESHRANSRRLPCGDSISIRFSYTFMTCDVPTWLTTISVSTLHPTVTTFPHQSGSREVNLQSVHGASFPPFLIKQGHVL